MIKSLIIFLKPPHLEPFDNANDPNRKFAKEEVEGIPSKVLSTYDGFQKKTADFFKVNLLNSEFLSRNHVIYHLISQNQF